MIHKRQLSEMRVVTQWWEGVINLLASLVRERESDVQGRFKALKGAYQDF